MRIIASGLSRALAHLKGDFGVVSAYRDENSDSENKSLHRALGKDIRALDLGFIELASKWEEDGSVSSEQSYLIPKISKEDVIKLGEKYKQFSVLSGTGGVTEHICSSSDLCGSVGKTLQVFKKGALSQADFKGAFSLLKKGSQSATETRFKLLEVNENQRSHF